MNARRIILAPRARSDLDEIAAFTKKKWGHPQKNEYLNNLINTIEELRNSPALGRTRDEVRSGLLSFPNGRHIIFYRYNNERLEVIRILHQAMEPDNHLT